MTIEAQVAALTEATTALLSAVNVAKATLDAAKDAAVAAQGNAQNYLGQTQYARDQALAGLGAVDNSQLTAVFMEQLAYLADLAGVTARDLQPFRMTDIRELLADHLVALGDIAGLAAREVTTRAKLVAAPATATSAGTKGEFAYDSSYIYVCTANNTWKRVGITTW